MISAIKTGLRITLKNWITLLFFVITYKLIGFVLVVEFIDQIKSSIFHMLGVSFLGQQNVGLVFQNPLAILLLICIVLIIVYYVYLEIVALILYCEAGWQGNMISIWQLWKNAFLRSISFFRIKNLSVILALIPLVGLSVLPLTYGFMNKLKIPEFILDYISGSPKLHIVFAGCILVLNVLAFFYLFCLPDVIVQKKTYYGTPRSSAKLMKGKIIKTAVTLLGSVLAFIILAIIITIACVLLLWMCSKVSAPADGGRSFFQFYFTRWSSTGGIFFSALFPVSLYASVIVLYHQYRGDEIPPIQKPAHTLRYLLARSAAVVAAIVFLVFFSETELGGNLYSVYRPSTEVIAHRAGAIFAPENTLAALENSIQAGADMAEIDVQQTRDGILIIMHDSNFLRTTSFDQEVWETDFATVQTLDAGSSYSRAFAGERIPTLEEMLAAAKGRIRLMIELKASGHEHNLVEETVRQINAAGMEQKCMIASMNLELLQRSKALAPAIETVYITSLAFSENFDLDYVDGYSVETSFLTLEMVTAIQSNQKKIYAWTANTDSNIQKIIRLGTDGLVTDNPSLANYYLMFFDQNHLVDDLSALLYGSDE